MNLVAAPGLRTVTRSASALPTLGLILDQDSNVAHLGGLAVDLAARFSARLIATAVIPPLDGPRYGGGLTLESVCREAQARAIEHALEGKRLLERLAGERGVDFEWRCLHGETTDLATLSARYADLTMMEQETGYDVRAALHLHPEGVFLGAGRPIIVVPHKGRAAVLGRRILVGWNGSREATRAVNDALLLLAEAQEVLVLVIRPESFASDPGYHGEEPGADIALYLTRHGIPVQVIVSSGLPGESDGACLFRKAADWGADLVVMGAFGRSRFREAIFGGTTRYALDYARVPVLFSA